MLPKSKSAPRPPDGFDSAQRCLPAYSRSAGPGRSAGVIAAVAGWSARHRALAIGGWLALVVVAVLSSSLVRGDSARSVDPGEAGRAQQMVDAQGSGGSIRENVLIQSRGGGDRRFPDDPELRDATRDLVAELRRTPGAVRDVGSPLAAHGERWVTRDGRSGLVTFEVAGSEEQFETHYETVAKAVERVGESHPRVRLAQAGDHSLSEAVNDGIKGDLKRAETTSLPLTVLILLVVFGSLVAAGIPLLLSATTVAAAFGLLQVVSRWVPFNSVASAIVLLIGMAVGIDYSLFYLRRVREERAAGHEVREALRITALTSGHAIVASGLTVMLCMIGLLFTGVDVFKGLTAGTVLVVGLAVLSSVTVLPALLAALGDRVDRARIPWLGRRRIAAQESRLWGRVARAVVQPARSGRCDGGAGPVADGVARARHPVAGRRGDGQPAARCVDRGGRSDADAECLPRVGDRGPGGHRPCGRHVGRHPRGTGSDRRTPRAGCRRSWRAAGADHSRTGR